MAKKKEPVVHDRGELAFVTLCGIFFGVGGHRVDLARDGHHVTCKNCLRTKDA